MKPGMTGKEKLDPKWEEGIWMGILEESGENIIATADGCIKVRSIRRKAPEDRWSNALLDQVKGSPWEPVPGHPDREIKTKVMIATPAAEMEVPEPVAREMAPKRVYIRKRDIEKYGTTVG